MSTSSINADAFISEALEGKQVWGIRDTGGFPTSTNGSGETAMPFWSSKERADRVIETVSAYKDFEVVPIDLSVFLERWLPGLKGDGLYCGLNWSGERATGYDMVAEDVLARFNSSGR